MVGEQPEYRKMPDQIVRQQRAAPQASARFESTGADLGGLFGHKHRLPGFGIDRLAKVLEDRDERRKVGPRLRLRRVQKIQGSFAAASLPANI
jgi:hypothetical protein